ncbi:TPR repeat protein-like protein [Clathrospora elynae]|uniref:Succinate dehydrogenase assembly factor 2, mitochondrial n=1 Tax=Clathrospora elynae TaxID=706981 RepID=A0A6A5SBW6_9PLEO|nr:TPR repeat protein-like protein [Clathrospora elynae]
MASSRLVARSSRVFSTLQRTQCRRAFSISTIRGNEFEALNKRTNDTAETYRKYQIETPLNPHLTNTTSTIANEMPSIGKDAAPPELITKVDSKFTPKDSVPENTQRMTGGTQGSKAQDASGSNSELGVGEMEGAKFKVEPIKRTGEDPNTMRARLLYQSRKRGTLESDLLLSTFADAHLATMSPSLMQQYDTFLDENDWDIYYWATQEPTPTSHETAEGGGSAISTPNAQGMDKKAGAKVQEKDEQKREPGTGEWAQTVGTFKPAYRPVPSRFKGSEILSLLRRHVNERKAGGVIEGEGQEKKEGKGLGMMPDIKNFDQ